MRFRIGSFQVECDLQHQEVHASRHTGAPLRQGDVVFQMRRGSAANTEITAQIQAANKAGVALLNDDGQEIGRWRVVHWSSSHQTGPSPTVYTYRIMIEETEQLMPQTLKVGDFELSPYKYREEFQGDALIIRANLQLLDDQFYRLLAFATDSKHFLVVRQGISSEPRKMQFRSCFWSRHDDSIKVALELGDHDDQDPLSSEPGLFNTTLPNALRQLAILIDEHDALLNLLVTKGVINDEERGQLKSASQLNRLRRRLEFQRVDDVDGVDRR